MSKKNKEKSSSEKIEALKKRIENSNLKSDIKVRWQERLTEIENDPNIEKERLDKGLNGLNKLMELGEKRNN